MTDRFYSYDPEDGFDEHESEDAAEKAAERALSGYRGEADEHGWPSGVESIRWGRLLPLGMAAGTEGTDGDGELWTDYHLATQPDELAQLRAQVATLTARVAELESPPVVPEGWEVSSRHGSWGLLDQHGYAVDADETGILHMSIDDYIPWPAVRALAWAIETDSRPPHESDSHGK